MAVSEISESNTPAILGSNTAEGAGVLGSSKAGIGVKGESENHDGVQGFSNNIVHSGVVGTNFGGGMGVLAQSDAGIGLVARGGRFAGAFDGNVDIMNGDLTIQGDSIKELLARVRVLNNRLNTLENFVLENVHP